MCFLRPCRGGKFSRAIIRPQITALHSQKSPLLGPHQQHNEGSKKPSTLEKCRNLKFIPLNFKKRRGPSSENSLGIYFTDDQKTDSFVLLSTVHAASLSASVGSVASAVSFLVKYIILYFHTCDYRRLSGALHLSLSIVRQVNMSSHANDTADRMEQLRNRKQYCSGLCIFWAFVFILCRSVIVWRLSGVVLCLCDVVLCLVLWPFCFLFVSLCSCSASISINLCL